MFDGVDPDKGLRLGIRGYKEDTQCDLLPHCKGNTNIVLVEVETMALSKAKRVVSVCRIGAALR